MYKRQPWELIAWLHASRAGSPDIARPSHEWVGKVRQGLDASSRDDSSAPALLDQFTAGNGLRASVPASDEAVTFLARVALGSPAVCLLRSLRRYAKEPSPDLASASASIAPVSYTHLDVYKRQA